MTEKLAAFAAAVNNELFDPKYKGGEWMVFALETQETLEQWEASSVNWNERSTMKTGEIAGFKFVAWESAQAIKGQQREPMSVIDFGEVRFVMPGTNLADF